MKNYFQRAVLLVIGAVFLQPDGPTDRWRVDGERLNRRLEELAAFGATPQGGSSRVAFSPEDRAARGYVIGLMEGAGLEAHIDLAGNIIGRRNGTEASLAPLMIGSHIDTVPDGGRFDGTVGVMAAIEVAQTLADHQHSPRHPLEIVVFANEEGGKTGSRLLIGEVMDKEFDLVTRSGRTIRDGLEFIGGKPDRSAEARRRSGDISAYLELHIEQGAVLDRRGIPIGVVQGIVGIKRWYVTVKGFANHAGTTPMDQRRDSLLAGSRFVDTANQIVRQTPGTQVATVGQIEAFPGAPNVIPGEVRLSLEIRDLDMSKIDRLFEQISQAGRKIGEETGTTFDFDHFYTSRAALTDTDLQELIEEAASTLNLKTLHLPSGAGHDAQSIALLGPIGMIFIPSVNGISHSPEEFSRPDAISNGADVLLQTILLLDGRAPDTAPEQ